MTDEYLDEIERQLSALFLAVERVQSRRVVPELGRLEKVAFHVMGRLVQAGPIRPSELAALAHLDVSTVSRQVAALETAGLISRTPDPADRRASLLHASPRGAAVLARLRSERRERVQRVVAGWSDDDRRELARLLRRLNADLGKADRDGAGDAGDAGE